VARSGGRVVVIVIAVLLGLFVWAVAIWIRSCNQLPRPELVEGRFRGAVAGASNRICACNGSEDEPCCSSGCPRNLVCWLERPSTSSGRGRLVALAIRLRCLHASVSRSGKGSAVTFTPRSACPRAARGAESCRSASAAARRGTRRAWGSCSRSDSCGSGR